MTSQQNSMPPSASTFACAVCHCIGLLQVPPASDADQVLTGSCQATSSQFTVSDAATTTINVHDDECSPLFVIDDLSSSENDQHAANSRDSPDAATFGVLQLKAGFVRLYQLVNGLVVQVTTVVSDVVSLKDRVAALEGTQAYAQAPALAHDLDTEALSRRVNELCERVASQDQRLAQQRAETELYKKTIQELTPRSEMKIDDDDDDDDKKVREYAIQDLRESLKSLRQSMECQAARVTAIKADAALKISLLQSELERVQMELAAVKTVAECVNAQSFGQIAKDARRAGISPSVAQQIEEAEAAEMIEDCPLSPVLQQSSACAQDQSVAMTSSSGQSIILSEHIHTRETAVDRLTILREFPLAAANTKFVQPCASIPSIPAMRTIPKTIPLTSVDGTDKENELRNKTILVSSGKTQKPPMASPKKIQPSPGSPSKASTLPKHRKSMLPGLAPRKSPIFPGLAKQAAAADGGPSNEAKTTCRIPRGSETPDQLKTSELAITPRAPLVSHYENEAFASSSSLAALDIALQALPPDEDGIVLTLIQVPDHSNADLSFSGEKPHLIGAKPYCERDSLYVPPKERTVMVKPSRRL